MNPSVVLIENEPSNVRNFQGAFDKYFTIKVAEIKEDLDDMIHYLLNLNADGYVIDYKFQDTMPGISYTGADLYNRLYDAKHELPLIILTGQGDKMMHKIRDPYHIVSKEELDNPDLFSRKLLQLIGDHKNKFDQASKRFHELVSKKSKGSLDVDEVTELNDIDSYLEQVIYKRDVIPPEFKQDDISKRLDQLLQQTETILTSIKKK